MRARESFVPWARLQLAILEIERLARMNDECAILAAIRDLVPEFSGLQRAEPRLKAAAPKYMAQ